MAAAAPAFTSYSRKQKEGRDGEGIWKTKDGHKFLHNCLTERWGFCPLPLNELYKVAVVILCQFPNPCLKKPGSLQSLGIFSVQEWALRWWNWPSCVPCWRGPVWDSGEQSLLTLASHHPHQHASRVAPVDQPTHQLNVTNWPSGGKNKFQIHKIVRNNTNDCCLKPLSLWVICLQPYITRTKFDTEKWGPAITKT